MHHHLLKRKPKLKSQGNQKLRSHLGRGERGWSSKRNSLPEKKKKKIAGESLWRAGEKKLENPKEEEDREKKKKKTREPREKKQSSAGKSSSSGKKLWPPKTPWRKPLTEKNAPSAPQVFIMQLERLSSVGSLHPPPLIDFILNWSLRSPYLSFSKDIFPQNFSVALFPHYRPTVKISKFSDPIWPLSI